EDPDAHVLDVEVRYRARPRDLAKERRAVDERAVGVAVDEVLRQVPVEPAHVRGPHRADESKVELLQCPEIGSAAAGLLADGVLNGSSPPSETVEMRGHAKPASLAARVSV